MSQLFNAKIHLIRFWFRNKPRSLYYYRGLFLGKEGKGKRGREKGKVGEGRGKENLPAVERFDAYVYYEHCILLAANTYNL